MVEVTSRETPVDIDGWGALAALGTYYLTPNWLRYVDADEMSSSTYWGATVDGALGVGLSTHVTAAETNHAYVVDSIFGAPQRGDALERPAVRTLGGRRGYLSSYVRNRQLASDVIVDALTELFDACMAEDRARPWWWPYVDAGDAETILQATARFPAMRGAHAQLARADCVIDLTGQTIEDHVESLGTRQRRAHYRREIKRFETSGLHVQRMDLSTQWRELAPLLTNLQRKYGDFRTSSDHAVFFERQAHFLAPDAVLFGCYQGEQLIAFSLCYETPAELSLRSVGFDYEALLKVGEYGQLAVHAPLQYCYENRIPRLHLGSGSYEAKTRRGAKLRPLWALLPKEYGGAADPYHNALARIGELPQRDLLEFSERVADQASRLGSAVSVPR